MSNHMVKLKPSHRGWMNVKHPLLDTAGPPLTPEQLEDLVPRAIAGDQEARDALVLGHLAMLRTCVGRYLKHWPMTRRFLDEMVSVGLLTLTRVVKNLDADTLGDRPLGYYLLSHICDYIEVEITLLRGMAPASRSTNKRRMKEGKPPIFGSVEASLDSPRVKDAHCYYEPGFEEVDTLEVIDRLRVESHHCELLLDKEYWGLDDSEASKRTGIPRTTVRWYRTKMLKRYHELTGNDQC